MLKVRAKFGSVLRRAGREGYYCRFSLEGKDRWRYGGPTLAIARANLQKAQGLLASGSPPAEMLAAVFGDEHGSKLSFIEATDGYMAFAKNVKKPSTFAGDKRRFRVLHKTPWGSKKLSAIRPDEIQTWIDKRLSDGASPATVNRDLSLGSALFRWALRMNYAAENPFRRVPKLSEKGRGREVFLTAAESRDLLAAASPLVRPVLHCAVATGLRRGELLSLRWDCVSFERTEVFVRAGNAKSGKGRAVPMTRALAEELAAIRPTVTPIEGPGAVFLQANGKPMTETVIADGFKAARRISNLSPEKKTSLRLHDLRHTFASLAVAAGVPIFDLSKLMGHGDVKLTASRYSHFMAPSARAAIDRVDVALGLGGAGPLLSASVQARAAGAI